MPKSLVDQQLAPFVTKKCAGFQSSRPPHYNLLFRCFVGLNMDDAVWDATHPSAHW